MSEIITWGSQTPIVLLNKSDRGLVHVGEQLIADHCSEANVLSVSAKDGTGFAKFEARLEDIVRNLNRSSSSVTLTCAPPAGRADRPQSIYEASLHLSVTDQTELAGRRVQIQPHQRYPVSLGILILRMFWIIFLHIFLHRQIMCRNGPISVPLGGC